MAGSLTDARMNADAPDPAGLSGSQFAIWLGQELDPELPLYNMVQVFRIEGAVDAGAFGQAWSAVLARSDALRTVIETHAGVPRRVVRESMAPCLEAVDLRDVSDADEACTRWIEARKAKSLRLDERMWDAALLRLPEDVTVWYLCQHHLITDAQSVAIVFRRVSEAYQLAVEGRLDELGSFPQYEDHLARMRGEDTGPARAASEAYWAGKLDRVLEPTPLYGRTISGVASPAVRLSLPLGEARSERLKQITHSAEISSLSEALSHHSILLGLLAVFLHRTSGLASLRVGTPFHGRETAACRDTIGLFMEMGCVDLEVAPDDTFVRLIRRAQRELIQGMIHARPGASSPALNRTYDVVVNNVASRFGSFAGLPVTAEWLHPGYGDPGHVLRLQSTAFDLTGGTCLHFDVNRDLLGGDEATWLVGQFSNLVDRFLEEPGRGIGSFDLLDDGQRGRLAAWNDTDAEYPREYTVVDLFERQVAAMPDAIAVEAADGTLSYRALDARANAIADLLRRHGAGPGARVAIVTRRSALAVSAILGTLKAGAAYVPIDPAYPAARQAMMIEDAEPAAVITDGSLGASADLALPVIELAGDQAASLPAEQRPACPAGPQDLAYIIYTSGSTGRPKGTLLTHRGLVNYLWWARAQYTGGQPASFALYSSLSFDLTVTSLFLPLIVGGRIVVYQGAGQGGGLEVLDVFAEDRVDVVKLTPSHLSLVREHGFRPRQRIRSLIVGGEILRTELARAASEGLGAGLAIYNEYGPTEAVVGCMIHRFEPARDAGPAVPIGHPAANTRILVLDAYDRPTPPGVVGEMVISSDGVALGYRNRPELTAKAFDEDPSRPGTRRYRTGDLARRDSAGELEFLGRGDQQVKVRGARVELGEIEAAALACPGVEAAVADVVAGAPDSRDPIRHCIACGLSTDFPGADLDERGECADCRSFARRRHEVARYFRTPADLEEVLRGVRGRAQGRAPDCIVLTSGGKDSTYMLYRLVRSHGMRPLVFTLDNGYLSDTALDNVRAACDDLGVELHVATTPHMGAIFADSLRRHANVCDGCFKTVYTLSMSLARARGIGTIITGLSRGQMFETRLADTFAAGEFDPDRIDTLVNEARKAYHHIDDAVFQLLDNDLFSTDDIFDDVRFIDFYRYVDVGLDEVYGYLARETAWKRPKDTGRSTNCLINDVGIFVHRKMRGFHNYSLPYSWDVRLGHKRREVAMRELEDEIDTRRVEQILHDIGYEEPLADAPGDQGLAVYFVAREGVGASDLRAHLAASLPGYMVPAHLVPLPALPLTANGKIDRAALPDPREAGRPPEVAFIAPRSETEKRLAAAWAEVFRRDAVGVNDNFFAIGGDSVTSIQIVAAARRAGLGLAARDIFTHQTVADLAVLIESRSTPGGVADALNGDENPPLRQDGGVSAAARARLAALPPAAKALESVEDAYRLTPTQMGMLYHSLAGDDGRVYVGQGGCIFRSPVNPALFRAAWRTVCQRHPATRTRILWQGLDVPLQVVQREVDFPWVEHDWTDRSASQVRAGLEDLRKDLLGEIGGIGDPALMGFALVHTREGTHFIWNSHHVLLDGWSAQLLFDEVLAEYEALAGGTRRAARQPPPFGDHVEWLYAQDREAALDWWRSFLSNLETPSSLPLPAPVPGTASGHASVRRALAPAVADRLRRFAQQQQLTVIDLVNSAWALLLSHYSGSDDVVFGVTVSGREEDVPGSADMIGMLISTLPLRVRVSPEQRLGDWLKVVQEDALALRRHGFVGLPDIQRLVASSPAQPLFDSIVVGENFPAAPGAAASSLLPTSLEISAASHYPLALLVHTGGDLVLEAFHDRARLRHGNVERLLGHMEQALVSMSSDAMQRLRDVTLLTEGERTVLLRRGRGAALETGHGLAHERVAGIAALNPDSPAVTGADGTLTYGQLWRRSRQIAARLRESGIVRGDHVGVVVGASADLVAAILAVLQIGATYVPVDEETPVARLRHVVAETSMRMLVVDRAPDVAADTVPPVLDVRHLPPVDLPAPHAPPAPGPQPGDAAYVIYTSGSTGTPKGVVVTHRNLAASTSARLSYYPGPVGTFLLLSPLAFDSSLAGLFWTLATGGRLVVATSDQRRDLAYLRRVISQQRVTHTLALPSLYSVLLSEASADELGSLRTVVVAGEACPASLIALHRSNCPQARLFNEYGPTEATIWSHVFAATEATDSATVPIGQPIPGSVCEVVDHFGHLAPVGVSGELLVGGAGVADGYLNQPALTARAFIEPYTGHGGGMPGRCYRTGDLVRWREDGQLDFLGRLDRQVKLRGYRIELDEVEAALSGHPGLRAVAAVLTDDALPGRRRLAACYCAEGDFDDTAWRREVADRLPSYMLPSTFTRLDDMPRTPNGKVDRRALSTLLAASAQPEPARSDPVDDVERSLLDAWSRLLGVEQTGVHQSFFELGGTSLDAMRLFAFIEREFGCNLLLSALIEAPTVAELANLVRRARPVGKMVPVSNQSPTPRAQGQLMHVVKRAARLFGRDDPSRR